MSGQLTFTVDGDVSGALRGLDQLETKSQKAFRGLSQSSNLATRSLIDISRVAQDAPYGFIAIANNLNPLVESFGRLKAETGSAGNAFKALAAGLTGPAGIGLAVGVVSSLFVKYGDQIVGLIFNTKGLTEEQKKYNEAVKGSITQVSQEVAKVETLVTFIKLDTTSKKERNNAIKELQSIAPGYFATLDSEKASIEQVTIAYDKYLRGIRNAVEAKVIEKQLQEAITKRIEAERTLGIDQPMVKQVRVGEKLIMVQNAIYQDVNQTKAAQKELNQAKLDELNLSKQLAALQPPKLTAKDFTAPKVKQEKPLDLVFQPIVPNLDKILKNKIIEALKSKDILSESEQIGKLINDSIAKNIKPLPKIINPKTQNQLDEQKAKINEQLKVAQGVASGISNAFGQAFSSILEGENVFNALGNALKGFVLELVQATIKALIFRAIVNAFVPGGASAIGSTGIANLLGFRANGGPVSGQSPYIVGERGPELFVPSVSGNVVPNNRLSGFNGRPAFASSMGGRSIVRGNDILLAYARTQRSQNRVNG